MFAAVRLMTPARIIAARSVIPKASAIAFLSTKQAAINEIPHDEHVDPEVHFMTAGDLKADHARLQKMEEQAKDDMQTSDWPTVDKIMQEEHEHEDDPEHFVMNDKELEHQKVLKQQQKDKLDKEDDIRHHAWE